MDPIEHKKAAWPFQPTITVPHRVVRPGYTKGLIITLIFGFGVIGLIPGMMPLWLAILMTIVGALGLYLFRDRS